MLALLTALGLVALGMLHSLPAPPAPIPKSASVVTTAAVLGDGKGPLIVYSPHPDDETWGMAFEIISARRAGRPVYGVLLTDGEGSASYQTYYRKHPELWADLDHDGVKGTRWDFGLARRAEYTRSMEHLGVPAANLSFFGRATSHGATGLADTKVTTEKVAPIVERMAALHPGATHITTMDHVAGEPAVSDARLNPDHVAVARALKALWERWGTSVALFKVYVYSLPWAARSAPTVILDPLDMAAKGAALQEFAPGPGRPGIGSTSSKDFYDSILLDPREFMVRPQDY